MNKTYYQKNRKKILEKSRDYYKRHKKEAKIRHQKYWQKNKHKLKKSREEYYSKNKKDINAYRQEWIRKRRKDLRSLIIKKLGSKCKKCGFSDTRALQIDHINGGGAKEIKLIYRHNAIKYYRQVLSNLKKYQLLCANCNWIKIAENKESTQPKIFWEGSKRKHITELPLKGDSNDPI